MPMVTFKREFRQMVERSRKHCVLCKVLALVVHPVGTREVDEETAAAAEAAGAGERVS